MSTVHVNGRVWDPPLQTNDWLVFLPGQQAQDALPASPDFEAAQAVGADDAVGQEHDQDDEDQAKDQRPARAEPLVRRTGR